ncbi:MAG: serine hydrolase [Bacteroidota bacterium]|nr:serine hydrolase [Bacteroidota bacterium]
MRLLLIPLLILFFCQTAISQDWIARHGISAADYQAEFNKWTQQGYRPVNISVYNNHFAVIFEKQNNPPVWSARHGISSTDFQNEYNKWVQQGYRPVHISGYTIGKQVFYAAIFEKRPNSPEWAMRYGLSTGDYQNEFNKWTKQGYKPTDISTYTVNGQDYYAVIFDKIVNAPAWTARHGLSFADYQNEFNKWTQQGYRPTIVTANSAGHYAAVWEKAGNTAWIARHGLGAQQYQDEFDRQYYQGYRPVWVNGVDINGQDSYSAIWEAKETFRDADMKKVDNAVKAFMNKYNVPGLSFSLVKDGRLVLVKTYGYANKETGEMVAPRHRFRIASVTKPFTSTAIMKLYEQNKLKMDDKIFGNGALLGNLYGTPPYKKDVDKITVQNFLNHNCGGWAGDLGFDPMFNYTNLNKADLIKKTIADQPLQKTPGTEYHYSNFGFCVLGRVIEKISGQNYDTYIKNNILAPCGISNMEIGGDIETEKKLNEVKYYGQDGEDPYNMKISRMDSHGGWIANPIDLARFLVRVDKFATKPDILKPSTLDLMYAPGNTNAGYAKGWAVNTVPNYWHNGSLPGEQSLIVRTNDGYCWAVLVNTRSSNIGGDMDGLMWTIKNDISYWPGWDLF